MSPPHVGQAAAAASSPSIAIISPNVLVTAGDVDGLWPILAGLVAYLAVTRVSGWGHSSD